ncbi:MAG: FG-GAP-like repeat-containing protein [Saprospiraceae bacterium]
MKIKITIYLFALLIGINLNAQQFTQVFTGAITTSNNSSGGCSWIDYNNDGHVDLFVTNTNTDSQLFKNNGDGTFEEITTGDIVNDNGVSACSIWGDYDNDGNIDVFVSNNPPNTSPAQLNFLYKNDGAPNYSFSKILAPPSQDDANYTWSSSWVDYDNDGDIDLHMPDNKHLKTDFFYENNGDGTFTSVSPSFVTPNVESTGVVSWIDYDHDGDQDLFMIKSGRTHPDDGEDNRMYHNLLKETGSLEFQRVYTAEMVNHFDLDFQASWGDYDNDGDMDVYLGNFDAQNYLYRNEGDSIFTQITTGPAVTNNTRTLGSTFGDFDNDGDLDLYVLNTNGQVSRYYQNDGAGNFTNLFFSSIGTPVTNLSAIQGCANADYNNDGYLDLYVANSFTSGNAKNFLYKNNGGDNKYLLLTCKGTISNSSAIGTKIWVKATINGNPLWQLRHITGSPTGNRAQNDLRVHFGLGDATTIDSLVIEWPLGLKEAYTSISSNQILEVIEGEPLGLSELEKEKMALTVFPNPAQSEININYQVLHSNQKIQIKILDNSFREVKTIFEGVQQKGFQEFNLKTNDWTSGTYYLALKSEGAILSKKIIIIK